MAVTILQIALTGFWMIVIPLGVGAGILQGKRDVCFAEAASIGYAGVFCLAEILLEAAIFLKLSLHMTALLFGGLSVLTAFFGVSLYMRPKNRRARRAYRSRLSSSPGFWMLLAAGLVILQTVVVVLMTYVDADDSNYVGTATTTIVSDSLYRIHPYTGKEFLTFPKRYGFSPFPALLAVFFTLFGNVHPAVMAHVFYPAVLIPLSYLVLSLIGRKLFPEDRDARGIFLLFLAVMGAFSGYSIYNSDNFRMVRIWQGKALLAGCFVPLILYLGLMLFWEKEPQYPYRVLAVAVTACCLLSGMAIVLVPLMTGLLLIAGLLRNRSLKRTGAGILCLLPALVLGGLYIIL